MAIVRFEIDGYGQFEPNNFNAPRTGRVEAQCDLNPEQFTKSVPAENGMILAIDKVHAMIRLPIVGEKFPLAINYSTERIYDERTPGLKHFNLSLNPHRPRMGYLILGDLWTTNTFCYDDGEFTDDAALVTALGNVKTTRVYGTVSTNGATLLTLDSTKKNAILMEVVKLTTMMDGQPAVQLRVVEEQ